MLPDISGHVVEAVAVGWVGFHRCRTREAVFGRVFGGERAMKGGSSANDEYSRGAEYYNDALEHCDDYVNAYFYPTQFAEEEFAELSSHHARMNQAAEYYQNAKRLYDNNADLWYELYESCDGRNEDRAYDGYELSREGKAEAAEEFNNAKECSSQLGKMKKEMLTAMPNLGD